MGRTLHLKRRGKNLRKMMMKVGHAVMHGRRVRWGPRNVVKVHLTESHVVKVHLTESSVVKEVKEVHFNS